MEEAIAVAYRWVFMRPWCEPLQGCLEIMNHDRGLTIQVCTDKLEGAGPAKLQTVRDALVLLATVGRVDFKGCKHLLRSYCGLNDPHSRRVLRDENIQRAVFVFELAMNAANSTSTSVGDTLLGLFAASEAPPNTDAVQAAVREIYERTGMSPSVQEECLDISLTMSVNTLNNKHHLPAWWRAMKTLYSIHGSWSFPGTATNSAFVLEPIMVTVGEVTAETVLAAEEIAAAGKGLTISYLLLAPKINHRFSAADAQAFGRTFAQVMWSSAGTGEHCGVIRRVHLFGDIYKLALVSRLCSAFANTRRTSPLSLYLAQGNPVPEERTRAWECLAYAFFSRHARTHSVITDLALDGLVLSTGDANAIAAVLASDDPANLLFGRRTHKDNGGNEQPAESRSLATGMLKHGTSLTVVPVETEDDMPEVSASWTLASDVHDVTELKGFEDEADGFLSVLVPGYGVCKVQRDQVVPTSAQLVEGGVKTLRLDFDRDEGATAGLPQLLEFIGSPLTTLFLDVPPRTEIWMSSILRSCPNLKELSVQSGSVNTQAFLNVYRGCAIRLERLDCRFTDIVALAQELTDSQTRLAQTLKRMLCSFDNMQSIRQRSGRLECVTSMLRTNRKLEHVELVMPNRFCAEVEAELRGFDNEAIPVVLEPLPLKSRLAFLSVFRSTRGAEQENAAKRAKSDAGPVALPESSGLADAPIDRLVFSTIFSFAATPVLREVNVTPCHLSHLFIR